MVMKNWEPFVSRPALAMERRPGRVCEILKFSSANLALWAWRGKRRGRERKVRERVLSTQNGAASL